MPVLYANRAFSTLASSITNVATSLSVAAGQGARFPAISGGDHFYATLDNNAGSVEIVKVTARSTDTFTIVRAQDGTSALAFNAGAGVELRVVKAMLDDFKTDTRTGYAPLNGTGATGTWGISITGNAATATALQTARTIGGVSFNGTANIDLPGVNTAGNQNTSGSAATLTTTRTLWGQNFNGSANVSGNLTSVGNITGTAGVTLTATSGTLALAATGANAITASTNGTERLRIDGSGNAGIGRQPQSNIALSVQSAGSIGFDSTTVIPSTGNTLDGSQFARWNAVTAATGLTYSSGDSRLLAFTITPGNEVAIRGEKLAVLGGNYLSLWTQATERVRITGAGDVGIGTATPAHRLDVTGAQNSVQARFGAVANRGLEISTAIIAGTNDAGSVLNAKGATSGTLIFQTDSVERMRIDSAGNVGVNNSNPKTKLDVAGPSGVTGFTGASRLGLTVRGSTSTNDFSGIDFIGTGGGANTNPLARIAAIFGSNGSTLIFGTSNNYSSGITNGLMQLDNFGNLGVGSVAATSARTYSLSDNSQHGIYGQTQGSGGSFYGVLGITTKASNVASGGVIGISSNGTTYGILGYNDTSQHWGGYFNGSTYATGTYQGSDARLKENVQTLSGSLQKITALRPVEFDWKQGSDAGQNGLSHDVGLIAQETLPVLPDIVKEVSGVSPLGGANPSLNAQLGTFYSIDYTRLIPHLIAAIQEQQALITNLIERVRALEAA